MVSTGSTQSVPFGPSSRAAGEYVARYFVVLRTHCVLRRSLCLGIVHTLMAICLLNCSEPAKMSGDSGSDSKDSKDDSSSKKKEKKPALQEGLGMDMLAPVPTYMPPTQTDAIVCGQTFYLPGPFAVARPPVWPNSEVSICGKRASMWQLLVAAIMVSYETVSFLQCACRRRLRSPKPNPRKARPRIRKRAAKTKAPRILRTIKIRLMIARPRYGWRGVWMSLLLCCRYFAPN